MGCKDEQNGHRPPGAHSSRVDAIPFSPVRRIVEASAAVEARGGKVFHLELGRPDFDTPPAIKRAAVRALDEGHVHYSSNYGIPELAKAIASWLERTLGVAYEPGREIVPTAGVGEGVFSTLMGLLDPGDEVVVIEPAWHHYRVVAHLAGARVRVLPTSPEAGFLPDVEHLEKLVGPRTRMLVLNSPNNPTGVVYPRTVLMQLGELARRHNLTIVSDEIYEGLVYEGAHTSIASLEDNRARTVVLNGFSKTYSMTGWRVGYVAAPKALADRILKIHQHNTVCPTTFAQYGAVEAYSNAHLEVRAMHQEFDARRREMCSALQRISGIDFVTPASAFYVFPRFAGQGADLADRLLNEASIACVPGSAFGSNYDDHIRLSFACSMNDVQDSMAALSRVLGS